VAAGTAANAGASVGGADTPANQAAAAEPAGTQGQEG
jgi:hypothetical protein